MKEQSKNSLNALPATENSIRSQLNQALRKMKLDHPLSRQTLIEVCKFINLHMSWMQATEAILYYRGRELD